MSVTTARLLRGVKRRITVPANQVLIDDSGMLELADDVMRDFMVPLIMSTRQNYFVVTNDVSVVESQALYDIPYRYLARGLRDIKYSGDGTDTGIYDLTQIALEDAHLFATEGQPSGFFFMGDQFQLLPAPINDSQFIRLYGEIPPSLLVQVTAAAHVTGISIGATETVITCSTVPTTMTAGVEVDFIQGKSGSRLLAMDIGITNVAGSQLTFGVDDVPSTLVVGDWISIAQTSPVLMMPDECQPVFETKICERITYAIGDFDGSTKLGSEASVQQAALKQLLEPRIQGEPTKIVNRHGLLRGRGMAFRGGGYYG